MAVRSLKNSTLENFANYSSSMNAGYSFQDYELIESVFVASNTASVTFNNLDQYSTDYKHLQIRGTVRTSHATTYDIVVARFNGDSGSNYSLHTLTVSYVNGIASYGAANTSSTSTLISAGATNSSGYYSPIMIDVVDAFSSIKNKTTKAFSGMTDGSVNRELRFSSGSWRNVIPITSVTLYGENGSFLSGSRLSIYGIR